MFFEGEQQKFNSVNVINCLAKVTVSLALGEEAQMYLSWCRLVLIRFDFYFFPFLNFFIVVLK